MTEVASYTSPLTSRGVTFSLRETPGQWNDIRTLIEGPTGPGFADGQPVWRWRAGSGGVEASRQMRFLDAGDFGITVNAKPPQTREEAAQLGALMVYAIHAGAKVEVDLALPEANGHSNYSALKDKAVRWAMGRFGTCVDSPVMPTEYAGGTEVAVRARVRNGVWVQERKPESVLVVHTSAPEIIGEGYAAVTGAPIEYAQDVVARMVGAPDFATADKAFRDAADAETPFMAAHLALGRLLDMSIE